MEMIHFTAKMSNYKMYYDLSNGYKCESEFLVIDNEFNDCINVVLSIYDTRTCFAN